MNFWFDFKYAWRLFVKTPGHSLLCVVVVALSVGLAIWTSALAYAMVFEPLPFAGSERWFSIQIAPTATARPRVGMDVYSYQEIVRRSRTIDHLGAFSIRPAVLSEGQASTSLRAAEISPRLLAATRVAPQMGRLFHAADSQAGATPVVILSHNTWQTYFAADPAVVGKQVRIDAQPMQVVGVMPKDFFAFEDSELWLPLRLPNLAAPGGTMIVSALVALEEGQTPEAVLPELKAPVEDVTRRHPGLFNAGRYVALIPAHRMLTHQNTQMVATLSFISLSVLLLGCVNISMVFLARLLERSRELALRTAVGASRSRLMRQCLLETALVVALGLLLGYVLASMAVDWTHTIGEFGARIQGTGRSSNVLMLRPYNVAGGIGAAALVWLLSTLIPAWRIARQNASVVLAGSGKGATGAGGGRSAGLLVGLQVTVSSVVLVICGNLVFAIHEEGSKPMGIDPAGIMLSTESTVFDARYADGGERLRYFDALTAAIQRRMAGTEVAYTTAVPTQPPSVPVVIEHQEGAANQGTLTLPVTVVSENYFEMLGIRLRSGRLFDSTDDRSSLQVAVLDEKTAERFWPGQNAIGKRLQLRPAEHGPWVTVAGIVSGVRRPYDRGLGVVYRPLRQEAPAAFHLLAKGPRVMAADGRKVLRAAAFSVDRDVPLHNLQTLVDFLTALNMMVSTMVPAFTVIAAITVILAATGLYGLISRSVAQRTQEVGVRRALGGTQWQVTGVFLRQGVLYSSVGLLGVGLGLLITNMLTTSIVNIWTGAVPATLCVLTLMALVIFTASYLPTRRAVALEPGDALRYD